MMLGLLEFGSPTWARTRDLRINSPSLYRLSYWRIWEEFYAQQAVRSSLKLIKPLQNELNALNLSSLGASICLRIKKAQVMMLGLFRILALPPGLEPGTCGLTVRRSTD